MLHFARPNRLRRLRDDTSGVAMVEFALSVPFLLTFGLWGAETANLALTQMRVAQLAVMMADNASRVGNTTALESRRVYESDINDIFAGAHLQTRKIGFFNHGRAIISSLEMKNNKQYIHWQRCKGLANVASDYGGEGTGLTSHLAGMGPAGEEVTASPGEAVIFVELTYTYQPLISNFFSSSQPIKSQSSFIVRDKRDLTGLYQRSTTNPDPVSSCGTFSTFT